jgi:galactokinase
LGRIWNSELSELDLRGAAKIRGVWTGAAHISYAYWRLGNKLLINALQSARPGLVEVECALKAYESALKFIRFVENPHLTVAIANNLSVARVAHAMYTGRQREVKATLKSLQKTRTLRKKIKMMSEFLGDAVTTNIRELREFVTQNKLSRSTQTRNNARFKQNRRRHLNEQIRRAGKA